MAAPAVDSTITLTTIGSRGVQVRVTAAALEEATGGITLWAVMPDGPVALTFTEDEARQLVGQALKVMA